MRGVREVTEPSANDPGRRRFLQLMGASAALAGAAGCRWERDHTLTPTRRTEGAIPGGFRHYATSMDLEGAATGLLVTSFEGRPIKVEGNPLHPDSGGATRAFHQASVLDLYDPDRSPQPTRRIPDGRAPATFEDFTAALGEALTRLRARGGRGLAVLSGQRSSPSLLDLRSRLAAALPGMRWYPWEPATREAEREGSTLAFGAPHRALYRFDAAEVILCLDADPLQAHPAALTHARAIRRARCPDGGRMARVYAVESCFSATGALADHRLPLRSELILPLAAALDAVISAAAQPLPEHGPAQSHPEAKFLAEGGIADFVAAVARELLENVGRGLILAGPQQPAAVHALCHRLDVLLGNVGSTVDYVADRVPDPASPIAALRALAASLEAGEVDTLLILGSNPVYDAPVDLRFEAALARAKLSVHASLAEEETSIHTDWHVPLAHFLEAWGDGTAWDGTLTLAQPLIAPLHGARSDLELLALLLDDGVVEGRAIVRRTHAGRLGDDRRWARAVQDGLVAGPDAVTRPALRPLPRFALDDRQRGGTDVDNGALELTFLTDPRVFDGRFANNAWLQELPDPFTKLTWGNAALIAPRTAAQLGVADGSLISLELGGRSLTLPAIHAPGQAPGSVRVALGYGRTRAGGVGGAPDRGVAPVGASAYALRTTDTPYIAVGLTVRATGARARLASTQHPLGIDRLGRRAEAERTPAIAREVTLAGLADPTYRARPTLRHPPSGDLWSDPVRRDGRRWGMVIDLSACIGCSACVVACTAENNVPVVGREEVRRGREMHWLRVDRYFTGSPEDPGVAFLPVACQHCENAPCEQVCPVGATLHSSEGLNDMVYNRCIGTRYCSNGCPYKVRRYNYFNYNLDLDAPSQGIRRLGLNPEVTVRSRGVMEKCSFCVQRIQQAKIEARNARRPLRDGEIVTACEQACPTQAIVFGDLGDPESRVAAAGRSRRAYELLGELGVRPRVTYLARARNPHPDLDPTARGGDQAPAPARQPPEHG